MQRPMRPAVLPPFEQRIADIHEKMESWSSFVRALNIPSEIAPAFMTGRVELMRLARPRPLSEEECRVLYELIGGLLETNMALRDHASAIYDGVANVTQGLSGAIKGVERLKVLATFREPYEEDSSASPTGD
jgi:hypothetical protein